MTKRQTAIHIPSTEMAHVKQFMRYVQYTCLKLGCEAREADQWEVAVDLYARCFELTAEEAEALRSRVHEQVLAPQEEYLVVLDKEGRMITTSTPI